MNSHNRTTVAVCALVLACLAVVGTMDRSQAKSDQALYCEMVETFKSTGGQYGWPDYRGNAGEICK